MVASRDSDFLRRAGLLVRMVSEDPNRPETTLVALRHSVSRSHSLPEHDGYQSSSALLWPAPWRWSGESAQNREPGRASRVLFGAVFFVSVGMMIDPQLIAQHWIFAPW